LLAARLAGLVDFAAGPLVGRLAPLRAATEARLVVSFVIAVGFAARLVGFAVRLVGSGGGVAEAFLGG